MLNANPTSLKVSVLKNVVYLEVMGPVKDLLMMTCDCT